jgi:hypothetical protein
MDGTPAATTGVFRCSLIGGDAGAPLSSSTAVAVECASGPYTQDVTVQFRATGYVAINDVLQNGSQCKGSDLSFTYALNKQ